MRVRQVCFVAYPGCQLLDFAGPFEVFAGANHQLGRPAYALEVAAVEPGPVTTDGGASIGTTTTLHEAVVRRGDTVIVVGGRGAAQASRDACVLAFLRGLRRTVRRASVCNGAFVLAAAGLLDGKRATTHWQAAEALARSHPTVEVEPDAIYVRDGTVWTSAGVTAGIDLALAMVEEDHDAALAQQISRSLVMFLRRPGGQSQFSTAVWSTAPQRSAIREVQDAVHRQPDGEWTIATLAGTAAMSTRNFVRVFTNETGVSPARYVERVRVEAARALLESTHQSVDAISGAVGFGTPETMRRAFQRQILTAPQEYRRRFQTVGRSDVSSPEPVGADGS